MDVVAAMGDLWREWELLLLDVARVQAWERLLFLECGDGWIAEEAHRRALKGYACGLDTTVELVSLATELRGVPGMLEFAAWDGNRLPCPDQSFDRVMSSFALQPRPEPLPLLTEIQRVLRPGGHVYLLELSESWATVPLLSASGFHDSHELLRRAVSRDQGTTLAGVIARGRRPDGSAGARTRSTASAMVRYTASIDFSMKIDESNAEMVGTYISSGIGDFWAIEREHEKLLNSGPDRVSPFFIVSAIVNLAAGQVSIRFGAKGPNSATATACAAGAHAIGDSFKIIQRGDADVMICGGAESAITPMSIAGFASMRALSTNNDDPPHASRPFERDRDGFVIGEGAGIMILEELESAKRRGAKIYGVEGEQVGDWILVDAGPLVLHIMQPAIRAHYNLEELWTPPRSARRRTRAPAQTPAG